MKEDLVEQLHKNHPHLFKRTDVEMEGSRMPYTMFGIECGDGWFNILDTLFDCIESDVNQAAQSLQWRTEDKNTPKEKLIEAQEKFDAAIAELPTIHQIKEKFGSLRFYYGGNRDNIEPYVHFAEALSGRTCEQCGNPGKSRGGGWIHVSCDPCEAVRK